MSKHTHILFVAVALVLLTGFTSCRKGIFSHRADGPAVKNLRETGELYTADTKAFVMPRFGRFWSSMSIAGLLEHGTLVQAGDSVIQLDPTGVQQFIVERETNLENQKAALQKIRVNNDIQEKSHAAQLRSEEASFNLAKLQLQSARFETEKVRKVKELQFRQAEIKYEKVKRNIEYSRIIARNEEKIQEIRLQQTQGLVDMAREVLPQLTFRSPISGVFQVATRRRGRYMLKVGDDVRAGNSIGSVPDLTWMKVKTSVNEVDRMKIHTGQAVTVRMDALPSEAFPAVIEKIGVLCHAFSDEDARKVFDVTVKISVSDERLRPGMTVSCEFLPDEVKP